MKKIHSSFLGLFVLFFITSAIVKPYESKRSFTKDIFVEISFKEDSTLFQPLSKAWDEPWHLDADLTSSGSSLMNYDRYKFAFKNRGDNLWTILHPMIIDGTIQSYSPYDPESMGLGNWDEGELRYPVNGSFVTSEETRDNLSYLLGSYGEESDVPLVDDFGDNIIVTHADGTQSFVYPPRPYFWDKDYDLVKYKLRVSILLNKNGKEKKRVIKSIAPVTYRIENFQIAGEKELIWLDFEELKPILKESHYFDENLKSISYLDYFRQKVKNAPFKVD